MAKRRKAASPPRRRAAARQQRSPSPAFSGAHFRVLIDGKELGFCQITRIHLADSVEPPPGRAPGMAVGPPSVVLRRAIAQDKSLYRCRERVAAGKRDLRTLTIQQCDPGGEQVVNMWVLHGCRPVRWSGPEFDALSSRLLFEELELSWERLEWV